MSISKKELKELGFEVIPEGSRESAVMMLIDNLKLIVIDLEDNSYSARFLLEDKSINGEVNSIEEVIVLVNKFNNRTYGNDIKV